jgi:hypothetical protein
MTLKSSRKPNHPLSMETLRRGKRQKLGCLVYISTSEFMTILKT